MTPERFNLNGDPATVTLQAAYAKNGKEAVQPLPPGLADRLAPWLATLPAKRLVFNLPKRTAAMIRVDLVAAGIPYETDSGVCDFHALRGAYISNLVASGASVKVCQTLARHSTPSLTIGIYARASLHDINGAVNALPDLPTETPAPEMMAATGTYGRHINKRLSLPFPYGGDGSGRIASEAGDSASSGSVRSSIGMEGPQTLEINGFDASCRVVSAPDSQYRRWDLNPHSGHPEGDFIDRQESNVSGIGSSEAWNKPRRND